MTHKYILKCQEICEKRKDSPANIEYHDCLVWKLLDFVGDWDANKVVDTYFRKYHNTHSKFQRKCFFKLLYNKSHKEYERKCWDAYLTRTEGDYENAKEIFKESLGKVGEDSMVYKSLIYDGLAYIANDEKQFKKAYYYINKAFGESREEIVNILDKEINQENFEILEKIKNYYLLMSLGVNKYFTSKNDKELLKAINYFLISNLLAKKITDKENSYILNNLGDCYFDLFKYYYNVNDNKKCYYYIKTAIESYENAILVDPDFSHPYSHLGILYCHLIKYKFDDGFEKIVNTSYNSFGHIYAENDNNIDLSLLKLSEIYFKAFGRLIDKHKDGYWPKINNNSLKYVQNRIKIENELKNNTKNKGVVDKVIRETEKNNLASAIINNKNKFLDLVYKKANNENSEILLKVLRQWNSFTPILNTHSIFGGKGGGYFLKFYDKGIVIDPGYNFLNNFFGSGHQFMEIDYVFISHDHDDHTADVESILTLLYQYNEYVKNIKEKPEEYLSFRQFSKNKENYKNIVFCVSLSVFKKLSGLLSLKSKDCYYDIKILHPNDKVIIKSDDNELNVTAINANHNDFSGDKYALGFKFEFSYKKNEQNKKYILIYSGDTNWNDIVKKGYEDIYTNMYNEIKKSEYKQRCKDISLTNDISTYNQNHKKIYKEILDNTEIVLLARLGGFKEHEAEYLIASDDQERNNAFYKNHLGRLGLASMCETLNPDLCLICEFGEEFKGNRSTITDIFNSVFSEVDNNETKFIPEEIGVVISFSDSIGFRYIFNPDGCVTDYKSIDSRPCLNSNEFCLIFKGVCSSSICTPCKKYAFDCKNNKPIFDALLDQIPKEIIGHYKEKVFKDLVLSMDLNEDFVNIINKYIEKCNEDTPE